MNKLNKKGVTLVELIVSFALVAVAVAYFFQTLYTVKKIYSKATKQSQEFVDKTYALRIADAYIDKNGCSNISTICNTYFNKTYFDCNSKETKAEPNNGMCVVTLKTKNGKEVKLYKNKYLWYN